MSYRDFLLHSKRFLEACEKARNAECAGLGPTIEDVLQAELDSQPPEQCINTTFQTIAGLSDQNPGRRLA